MNLIRAGRRLAVMSGSERREVVEAAWQLTVVSVRLSRQNWERVSAGLLTVEGRHDAVEHQRVVSTVARVARHLPGRPTCVPQALAAQRMMRRRAVASQVEFDLPDPLDQSSGHARAAPG